MEGSLSTFGGPSWGADSTSPQPPETRTRVPVQTPASPENTLLDDRRLQVNSIRGTRWLWLKFFSFFFSLKNKRKISVHHFSLIVDEFDFTHNIERIRMISLNRVC